MKQDECYIQSLGHPVLSNKHPPKTTIASIANRLRGKKAKGEDDEEDEVFSEDEDDSYAEGGDKSAINARRRKISTKRKRMTS